MAHTLFPPVVSTFMPAFTTEEQGVKIYFSYPVYSSIDKKNTALQVTVTRQDNNINALKDTTGVLFYCFSSDESLDYKIFEEEETKQYYFIIDKEEIATGSFSTDIFYKVQIRFDSLILSENSNTQNNFFKKPIINSPSSTTEVTGDSSLIKDKNQYLSNIENQKNFSEWSSVCLIRAIEPNAIYLNWEDFDYHPSLGYIFPPGTIPVQGALSKAENNKATGKKTKERLQSFSYEVLNKDLDVVYVSEKFFPEIGENIFQEYLDTENFFSEGELTSDTSYILRIKYTTANLYQSFTDYPFSKAQYTSLEGYDPYDPLEKDNENKRLIHTRLNADQGTVYFEIKNDMDLNGFFYIKRAEWDRKQKKWETIKIISCEEENLSPDEQSFIARFEDNTVCPQRWYIYSFQYQTLKGNFSEVKQTSEIFTDFEHTSLVRNSRQLNLFYNCQVNNFKNIVSRTKIDPLGGKYPKFIENAVLNYKQFSLSGTISGEADLYGSFLSKKDYYGEKGYEKYELYLQQKKVAKSFRNDFSKGDIGANSWKDSSIIISVAEDEENKNTSSEEKSNSFLTSQGELTTTTINDWVWERDFREEVVKWLNDGQPKLFRSLTEGVIPVILTDVSLTPKTQLSRRIWDFSATAYQVGDGEKIEDLISLGIVENADPKKISLEDNNSSSQSSKLYTRVSRIGQLYQLSMGKENKTYKELDPNLSLKNVVDLIAQDLRSKKIIGKEGQIISEKELQNVSLKSVKIYFDSLPHLYFFSKDYPTGVHYIERNETMPTEQTEIKYTALGRPLYSQGVLRKGYSIEFILKEQKTTSLFINDRKYYHFPDSFEINSLFLNALDIATIEYVVDYDFANEIDLSPVRTEYVAKKVIGQIQDSFKYNQAIGKEIRKKYDFLIENTSQRMDYWKGISVEAVPYALFSIRYEEELNLYSYIVGPTGSLSLLQGDFKIKELFFTGRAFFAAPESVLSTGLKEHEFILKGSVGNVHTIADPVEHGVYYDTGKMKKYMYLNKQWYECENNSDKNCVRVKMPVQAVVNYYGEVIETILN